MQPFGTVPAVVDGDYKIFGTILKKISLFVYFSIFNLKLNDSVLVMKSR